MNLRIWRMFTIYQQGKNWQDLVLDSRAAIGAEVSCRHIPGLASRRRRKRSRSCCDSHSHLFREPLNGLHNDSTRLQNQSGRSAIKVKMICQTFHTISTSGVKRYEHTIFCFVDVMAWPTVVLVATLPQRFCQTQLAVSTNPTPSSSDTGASQTIQDPTQWCPLL